MPNKRVPQHRMVQAQNHDDGSYDNNSCNCYRVFFAISDARTDNKKNI